MKSDITVEVSGTNELTIREGKAIELREPEVLQLDGVLDSPYRWLEKRISEIDQKKCYIVVNRQAMTIFLSIDEQDYFGPEIKGSLQIHPMFKKFAINTDQYLSNFDMAKLFKMNRTAFETQAEAMKLVSELQNFRAKVDKEVEKSNDNRGNKRDLIAQVVDSNLPDTFNLVLPIFKGTEKKTFAVEVYIKPDDFSCTLISPVANDLIEEMRDEEIDAVLDLIDTIAPDIVIIEQ